jgi:hypothetical protein
MPRGRPRKLIIKKEDTDTATETVETTDVTTTTDFDTVGRRKYTRNPSTEYSSFVQSDFVPPREGTTQDNMTEDQIANCIEGYIALRTTEEKEVLTTLPIFKTWVRYYNIRTKKFRIGGLLMKVVHPTYIMLVNTSNQLAWSVQLKDNIIFIRHPEEIERERLEEERVNAIKDRLYEMYLNGDLKRNE